MSGKPYPDGVRQFREALLNMEHAANCIEEESQKLQAAQTAISEQKERYRTYSEKLLKLMSDMDIRSSGNTGWEQRMLWFLGEMQRQTRTEPNV